MLGFNNRVRAVDGAVWFVHPGVSRLRAFVWVAVRRVGGVLGFDNGFGQLTAPDGSFTQVSAGSSYSCGIRTGGSVVCWGDNGSGQATAPDGSFTQVSAGGVAFVWDTVRWFGGVLGLPHAVFFPAGPDGGGGSVPGETGGGSAPVPGGVVGLGFEVIEYGRNLFWTPVVGVLEYEVDARESGGDRADYRSGITCLYTGAEGARCGYLFERDRQTSDAFRAASEFRVRAVGDAGAGAWSVWVTVGEALPGRVEELVYQLTSRGVVLFWDRLSGVDGYEVDARGVGGVKEFRDGWCRDGGCRYVVDEDWKVDGDFRAAAGYRVRAVAEAGAGPWSEWVTVEVSGRPARVSDVRYSVYSTSYVHSFLLSSDVVWWGPVRGADTYDVQYQYPGDPVKKAYDVAENYEDWEECKRECHYGFLRNPKRQVTVRVRAVNNHGTGPWSAWVQSVGRPSRAPVIESLTADEGFGADDVVVTWGRVDGAVRYKVEWQYRDYGEGLDDQVKGSSNSELVGSVLDEMEDSRNYRVIKPGRTIVRDGTSARIASVVENDEEKNYLLEFRVTALGDDGSAKSSNWVRWTSEELRSGMSKFACGQTIGVGEAVWNVATIIIGLYTGGIAAGGWAVINALTGPNVAGAVKTIGDCFADDHPVDVLRALLPSGITAFPRYSRCFPPG